MTLLTQESVRVAGDHSLVASPATIDGDSVRNVENLTAAGTVPGINLTAGNDGSILTAGGGASTLAGGEGADGFVISADVGGVVTINGFSTATGSADMIHFKGFPANPKLEEGGPTNLGNAGQLLVNGKVVVTMGGSGTATIIARAPSTFVKFIEPAK